MDLEQVKRLTLVALFDKTDRLREELVLKGGNLLDIVFAVSTRSSIDLDFSIAGNIPAEEIRYECEGALKSVFGVHKYQVIDLRIHEKPDPTSDDLKDFWGGYELEFKLVSDTIFSKYQNNVSELRKHALPLGPTGSPTF